MILLIDNYDSFVYNLARYFTRLGQPTIVRRNDAVTIESVADWKPSAIVLSPGPCGPQQAGNSLAIVGRFWRQLPMLGICLGHQTIAAALGARIERARQPMHGRSSLVWHDGSSLFAGLPNPLRVGRYHSLVVDRRSVPDELVICGEAEDGTVMAVRHRHLPVFGLQFHPESILTECGYELLANFLRLAGLPCPEVLPRIDEEWLRDRTSPLERATRPIPF